MDTKVELDKQIQFMQNLSRNIDDLREQYDIIGNYGDKNTTLYLNIRHEYEVMIKEYDLRRQKVSYIRDIAQLEGEREIILQEMKKYQGRTKESDVNMYNYLKNLYLNKGQKLNETYIVLEDTNKYIVFLRKDGANKELYGISDVPYANPCIKCIAHDVAAITGFPSLPNRPKTGDGAGPFGIYKPGTRDYDKKKFFDDLAKKYEKSYPDASKNLLNFLSGSGQPQIISPEKVMAELPGFNAAVEDTAKQIYDHIYQKYKNEVDKNGALISIPFESKFDSNDGWGIYNAMNDGMFDNNWFYALGGFSYKIKGNAVVKPPRSAGDKPEIKMSYQLFIFDRYNWDGNKFIFGDLTKPIILDSELARLQEVGLAREFNVFGVSGDLTYGQPKKNTIH